MWSKRLADIRPGTIALYVIVLLIAGYFRVVYGPDMAFSWYFAGEDYPAHRFWQWLLPVVAVAGGWLINLVIIEQFHLLRSHSYLGFLWGLTTICIGDFSVLFLSLFALLWYALCLRIQHASNILSTYLNIGLVVGIMMWWDVRYAFLLPIAWIMALVFRRLRWRAIFTGIWGILTVQILVFTVFYITGNASLYTEYLRKPEWTIDWPGITHYPWMIVAGFWWIYSLGSYIKSLTRSNILKRKYLSALLIAMLLSVGLMLTGAWTFEMTLPIAILSALIFVVNELQDRSKNWWKDTVFWTFWLAYAALYL